MLAFYTDEFVLPLPEGHRFPMAKYRGLRESLAVEPSVALQVPRAASDEDLALAHSRDWIAKVAAGALSEREQRQIGFPWTPAMVERSRRSVGASLMAAEAALKDGFAANLAGGTHHGFWDRGEGFCVFNDVAVAARHLQRRHAIERVLVIDLDVHQGNGTAAIFADDPSVFTLSLHGRGNYPFRKERSDLDVALADGTKDDDYCAALVQALQAVESRFEPDFLFYLAGADPYEKDRLGKLSLTIEGLLRRDQIVFDWAERHHLSVAISMAGGYAEDLQDIVTIHRQTVLEAARRAEQKKARSSHSQVI